MSYFVTFNSTEAIEFPQGDTKFNATWRVPESIPDRYQNFNMKVINCTSTIEQQLIDDSIGTPSLDQNVGMLLAIDKVAVSAAANTNKKQIVAVVNATDRLSTTSTDEVLITAANQNFNMVQVFTPKVDVTAATKDIKLTTSPVVVVGSGNKNLMAQKHPSSQYNDPYENIDLVEGTYTMSEYFAHVQAKLDELTGYNSEFAESNTNQRYYYVGPSYSNPQPSPTTSIQAGLRVSAGTTARYIKTSGALGTAWNNAWGVIDTDPFLGIKIHWVQASQVNKAILPTTPTHATYSLTTGSYTKSEFITLWNNEVSAPWLAATGQNLVMGDADGDTVTYLQDTSGKVTTDMELINNNAYTVMGGFSYGPNNTYQELFFTFTYNTTFTRTLPLSVAPQGINQLDIGSYHGKDLAQRFNYRLSVSGVTELVNMEMVTSEDNKIVMKNNNVTAQIEATTSANSGWATLGVTPLPFLFAPQDQSVEFTPTVQGSTTAVTHGLGIDNMTPEIPISGIRSGEMVNFSLLSTRTKPNGAYAQIARSGVSAANWFVGILLTPVEEDPKAFSRYSSLAM